MRFHNDAFEAGEFIGTVEGEAKIGHNGLVELVSINWNESVWCRVDDPNGEPVVLNENDRVQIKSVVQDALVKITDAGFGDLVIH